MTLFPISDFTLQNEACLNLGVKLVCKEYLFTEELAH